MRQSVDAGHKEILRQALVAAAQDKKSSHAWPALVASVAGDRAQLIAILQDADRRNARWGDAGLKVRVERAWRDDPEIPPLLARIWSGPAAQA